MGEDFKLARLHEQMLVHLIDTRAPEWMATFSDHQQGFGHIMRAWHQQIYPDRKNFYAIPDLRFFAPAKKFVDFLASADGFAGIERVHALDLLAVDGQPGYGLDYHPEINKILTRHSEPYGFPLQNVKRVLRGLSIYQTEGEKHSEWLLETGHLPGFYTKECLVIYNEFNDKRKVEAMFANAEELEQQRGTVGKMWAMDAIDIEAWRARQNQEPPAPGMTA